MASPAKIAANRQNAAKSTGPKTLEGKARSARNALTHGLTASPGEPSPEYLEYLAEWMADQKPKGIAQRTLVERMCRASWNLQRCDRYEDAIAAKRNRDAAELFDLAEASRAEALGRRLITRPAPVVKGANPPAAQPPEDDAATLVGELRRTAAGVTWLLARWAELARDLSAPGGWSDANRHVAIRLLGLRAESAIDHPVIGRIMPRPLDMTPPSGCGSWLGEPAVEGALQACDAAAARGEGTTIELWNAVLRAVASRAKGAAKAEQDAADVKKLKAMVRAERAKLSRTLKQGLEGRAAEDRAGAADRAMFEDAQSPSQAACLRYSTAANRDLQRARTELAKLRKESIDDERPSETTQTPETPSESPIPALQNEDPCASSREGSNVQNEPKRAPGCGSRSRGNVPKRRRGSGRLPR